MMDWDKLRVFHAVAEAGSFTRAGEALNLSQSAVRRRVSAWEESLKAPRFHRHARGLIVTEQGELLFRTVREVFAKLAMAEAQLSESKERPKGTLKVTASVGLGSTWLAPRIGEFIEIYPDVSVDLVLADGELDLSMREADVAIRLLPPPAGTNPAPPDDRAQLHLRGTCLPQEVRHTAAGRRPRPPQDHRLWRRDAAARTDHQLAADGRRS